MTGWSRVNGRARSKRNRKIRRATETQGDKDQEFHEDTVKRMRKRSVWGEE